MDTQMLSYPERLKLIVEKIMSNTQPQQLENSILEVSFKDIYLESVSSLPTQVGTYTLKVLSKNKVPLKYFTIYGTRTRKSFYLSEIETYNYTSEQLNTFSRFDLEQGKGIDDLRNIETISNKLGVPSTPQAR